MEVDAGSAPTPIKGVKRKRSGESEADATTDQHHAAAAKIQAWVRGSKARSDHKAGVLWRTWSALDWSEEQTLMTTHDAYEALKKAMEDRKHTDEEEGKKKKGKGSGKAPQTGDEAEQAMGLLLRKEDPVTLAWVESLMDAFRSNKIVPASLIFKLLDRVTPLLTAQKNVVSLPVHARLTVVGDLHGQYNDLMHIIKINGQPSARNAYCFNGDFVDRGQSSCECVLTLLAWKALRPDCVHLNRGNHEARDLNTRDGFEKECKHKYGKLGTKVFDAFSHTFSQLPLGALIENQVLVVHGGLFSEDHVTVDHLQKIDRFHEIVPSGLAEQILWSDPHTKKGPDVTATFLTKNHPINLVVRSHECMPKGYKMHHSDKVITVFSASNYTGTVGNDGALVVFERDGGSTAAASAAAQQDAQAAAPRSPRARSPVGSRPSSPSLPPPTLSRKQTHSHHKLPDAEPVPGVVPLKRSIIQFHAGAKEEQLSNRLAPHANLQTDILAKLLRRISHNRLALIDYWRKVAKPHSSGVHVITRSVWAEGLKHVLKLDIPWLSFGEMLGLPLNGVDGKSKGPIDHMAFLDRFRSVNLVVLRAQRAKSSIQGLQSQDSMLASLEPYPSPDASPPVASGSPVPVSEDLQHILELLHARRFELESLFAFLDVNGDDAVTADEFREGLRALKHQLPGCHFTPQQIEGLMETLDQNGDGIISYSEFFSAFELHDPFLSSTLRRSDTLRAGKPAAHIDAQADSDADTDDGTQADEEEKKDNSQADADKSPASKRRKKSR